MVTRWWTAATVLHTGLLIKIRRRHTGFKWTRWRNPPGIKTQFIRKHLFVILCLDWKAARGGSLCHRRVIGLQIVCGTVKGAPTNHINSQENKKTWHGRGREGGGGLSFINTAQLEPAAHKTSCRLSWKHSISFRKTRSGCTHSL